MLNLNNSKKILNWQNKYNFKQSVKLTPFWVNKYFEKNFFEGYSRSNIELFLLSYVC
jgi:hypothetical protein